MNIFKNRKFRYGSLSVAVSALFIAAVVIVNMIVAVLVEKFPINLDLTSENVFNLTEESVDFVSDIENPVEIIVLNNEQAFTGGDQYFIQANAVISKYAQHSDKITVKYVDLIKDPTFAANYSDEDIAANDIIVQGPTRRKIVTAYDLFNIEQSYYGGAIASSKAEQSMTAALMYVASDELVEVSILSGHDEGDVTALNDMLVSNNYVVTAQNLVTEEINPNAKIIVLYAPKRDLDDNILKKLDTFLQNDEKLGRTLLYVADKDQPEMPKLDAYLEEWGIRVNDGIVFDTDNSKLLAVNNPFFNTAEYVDEDFAMKVKRSDLVTTVPFSRPIELLYETKSYTSTKVLLKSSATSGIYPPNSPEDWQPSEVDMKADIPVAVLSTKYLYVDNEPATSNIMAIGSTTAFESSILSSTSVANSEYLLGALGILSEKEDSVYIEPKVLGGKELGINAEIALILGVIFMAGLPLCVLIGGLVVWLTRRHR